MASNEQITTTGPGSLSLVDDQLLKKCRDNDPDAQQQLYLLCHPLVSRVACRFVGQQDALDVTQQVFMRVFQKIESFAGRAKFETWLYRLTVNEALQHLRSVNRRKAQTLAVEPMSRQEPVEDRENNRELLDQALDRLAPEMRMIFILKEVEAKSYEEIASIAEIPSGTVGSRLNRARRELRQHLSDLGWEP